jgi:CHAD domain-containing protein
MSFELKPEQSLRKGIRRIVRKQMDRALEHLTGPHHGSRDEAVHEARKCFKKIRAVLRLVRPVTEEKCYREENIRFRDAGRPLTQVRDAKIFLQTLDLLAQLFKEHLVGRSFVDVRQALLANLRAVRKRVLDEQNAFAVVAEAVRQAYERINSWADVPNKWGTVGEGLEDVYRRAQDADREAAADPSVAKLHEWRKQAKYLRYQLEVLRPLWPERMEELANETDRIGELLGDDHDLAALRQMLTEHPDRFGDESDRELLLALIDRRRAELEQEALMLGRRFFQDSPQDFARPLKGYWKTWRAQPEPEPSGEPRSAKAEQASVGSSFVPLGRLKGSVSWQRLPIFCYLDPDHVITQTFAGGETEVLTMFGCASSIGCHLNRPDYPRSEAWPAKKGGTRRGIESTGSSGWSWARRSGTRWACHAKAFLAAERGGCSATRLCVTASSSDAA